MRTFGPGSDKHPLRRFAPPNVLRSEERKEPTIKAVVDSFMRNESGFSRAEVNKYVNRAIANEAADLYKRGSEGEKLLDHWDAVIDEADKKGSIPSLYMRQRRRVYNALSVEYDAGRVALAKTIRDVQRSGKVFFEPQTCRAIVDLDYDDLMSETMEVNVAEFFGINPDYDPLALDSAKEAYLTRMAENDTSEPRVDFTREQVSQVKDFANKYSQSQQQAGRNTPGISVAQSHHQPSRQSKEELTPIRRDLLSIVERLKREDQKKANDTGLGLG